MIRAVQCTGHHVMQPASTLLPMTETCSLPLVIPLHPGPPHHTSSCCHVSKPTRTPHLKAPSLAFFHLPHLLLGVGSLKHAGHVNNTYLTHPVPTAQKTLTCRLVTSLPALSVGRKCTIQPKCNVSVSFALHSLSWVIAA